MTEGVSWGRTVREEKAMGETTGVTVVFGGGGLWGVGWLTGMAMGLAQAGVDLRRASRFIGTSAGSVVSTQIASGCQIEALYERQTDPAKQPREPAADPDKLARMMALATRSGLTAEQRRHEACALARTVETISWEARRAAIVERLGLGEAAWPEMPLSLTAVDLETEELRVLDAGSGVSLVDAVAASCAVPGVWPPARIGGRAYVDGGVSDTPNNAHLAAGARAVLILSPMGRAAGLGDGLAEAVALLSARGAKVAVVTADQASLAAMAPHDVLHPATRAPAAAAGLRQAAWEVAAAADIFALAPRRDRE
jgi:NTE family protein